MTLLPIIYTSLIIFGGLFFVVVIFSWLSYKARTRGHQQPYQKYENPQQIIFQKSLQKIAHAKPVEVRVQPAPLVQHMDTTNVRKSDFQNSGMIRTRKNTGTIQKFQRMSSSTNNEDRSQVNSDRFGRSYTKSAPRISVVNETKEINYGYHNPITQNASQNFENAARLNFLTFYSDQKDSGFVTVNTYRYGKVN